MLVSLCVTILSSALRLPHYAAAMFETLCGASNRIWTPWKTDLRAVMFVLTLASHCAEPSLRGCCSHGEQMLWILLIYCWLTVNERVNILFITWRSLSATRTNVSTVCKPWICWNITHLYITNLCSFWFNLILNIMLWQCCGCRVVRLLSTRTRLEILPKSSQKYGMVSHVQMLKYSLEQRPAAWQPPRPAMTPLPSPPPPVTSVRSQTRSHNLKRDKVWSFSDESWAVLICVLSTLDSEN